MPAPSAPIDSVEGVGRRTFQVDVLECQRCGYSPLRVVAVVATPTPEQLAALVGGKPPAVAVTADVDREHRRRADSWRFPSSSAQPEVRYRMPRLLPLAMSRCAVPWAGRGACATIQLDRGPSAASRTGRMSDMRGFRKLCGQRRGTFVLPSVRPGNAVPRGRGGSDATLRNLEQSSCGFKSRPTKAEPGGSEASLAVTSVTTGLMRR